MAEPKKTCPGCGKEKSASDFHKRLRSPDGLDSRCKLCNKERDLNYRRANKERIADQKKQYYQANKEKEEERKKRWQEANQERASEHFKEYYKSNKDRIIKNTSSYQRQRLQADPVYRFKHQMRQMTSLAFFRRGFKKDTKTAKLLGADWQTVKSHIESQFKVGMCWSNRDKWHIDHIVPVGLADTPEEVKKLCHYTNLQPLWAEENLKKGCKTPEADRGLYGL